MELEELLQLTKDDLFKFYKVKYFNFIFFLIISIISNNLFLNTKKYFKRKILIQNQNQEENL